MTKQTNPTPESNFDRQRLAKEEPMWISEDMLSDQPEDTRIDFEQGMSYFPPLTLMLITANIVVFIWQITTGALESQEAIIASGALERGHLLQGELWRLVSPMFLHGSLSHLIGNCSALYILGIACEHVLSFRQAGMVYLFSGICGSLLSVIAQPEPSIGASGAIFGLMAFTVVFLYKHRQLLFVRDRRIGTVVAVWGLYTIAIGFLTPYVDNFAHIGGAMGGGGSIFFLKPALLTRVQRSKGGM